MNHSVSCVYGDTLFGKTTFLSSVLRWGLAQNPQFKARLVTCENWDALAAWEAAGILEVWDLNNSKTPFDALHQAVSGLWPENPQDPNSKVKSAKFPVGANFFEGMASIGDLLMGGFSEGGLAARGARKERIGPAEETINFQDGNSKVGGNPRTHYNIVQRWIHGSVIQSKSLSGVTIWTSHETVAKDERSQKLILGPEIVGTAATAGATRWFGNTIHALRVDHKEKVEGQKESRVVSEYRLYLKPHFTEEIPLIPYKAAIRVPPEAQEMVDERVPDFIPNNKDAFATLMRIREDVDALTKKFIEELRSNS